MTAAATDADVVSILHQAAVTYARNGVHVFPCQPRGKQPATGNGFHDATCDADQVDRWWRDQPDANIGIALGASNVFIVDVDGPEAQQALDQLVDDNGNLPDTYTIDTGREGGRHLMFRQPTGATIGNRKLAAGGKLETRGDGGYAIAPPSVHPSGRTYTGHGKWTDIAPPPDWLVELARRDQTTTATAPVAVSTRPTDRAHRALLGAAGRVALAEEGNRNDLLFWAACRAGAMIAGGQLEQATALDVLAQAAVRAGLDDREIGATLQSGLDTGAQEPEYPHDPDGGGVPAVTTLPDGTTTVALPEDDEDDVPSSWLPVDLTDHIDGTYVRPDACVLLRTDTHGLLYPGRTHALYGPPESGKTWIALAACAETLAQGLHVAYVDFENDPDDIVSKLKLLGATTRQLTDQLHYMRPEAAMTIDDIRHLRKFVDQHPLAVAVIDGVTNVLGMHDLDGYLGTDIAQFDRMLPKPLARGGAAVLMVDHTSKNPGDGNRYAIGSQHKLAVITGAAYLIKADRNNPFAPGRRGTAQLEIAKDRPGTVRGVSDGNDAGTFVLDSTGDTIDAYVEPPDTGPFRPTHYMARVSEYLSDREKPPTAGQIQDEVTGKKEVIAAAVKRLIAEGHVVVDRTTNGHFHRLVEPFMEVTPL